MKVSEKRPLNVCRSMTFNGIVVRGILCQRRQGRSGGQVTSTVELSNSCQLIIPKSMQSDPVVSKASELLRLGLMASPEELRNGKVRHRHCGEDRLRTCFVVGTA